MLRAEVEHGRLAPVAQLARVAGDLQRHDLLVVDRAADGDELGDAPVLARRLAEVLEQAARPAVLAEHLVAVDAEGRGPLGHALAVHLLGLKREPLAPQRRRLPGAQDRLDPDLVLGAVPADRLDLELMPVHAEIQDLLKLGALDRALVDVELRRRRSRGGNAHH